jgi:hypothetical protein
MIPRAVVTFTRPLASLRSPAAALAFAAVLVACGDREPGPGGGPAAPAGRPAGVQEPIVGGPYPALLLTQAQFTERVAADGSREPVPGAAKLVIVRQTPTGWQAVRLEDPESNTFHKAMAWNGGILTIGATRAALKVWRFAEGAWRHETHWQPTFGGRFDRLRDVERGDVDGDGRDELVVATHDQGVIGVVHPDEQWRVEEIARQPDTFVHEIEIGDVDGDARLEFFTTPSKPNKLGVEQPGEVRMYRWREGVWQASVVDAPGDTHAKEILAADTDADGTAELYVVWEGAVGPGGGLLRPVTIRQYRFPGGTPTPTLVASVPDRQMRALAAGDVNGDGSIDLVGGSLRRGVWLFEQAAGAWRASLVDDQSSGFEHPVHVADLDGDGRLEIYVAAEDQQELRRHRWVDGVLEKTRVIPLHKGDITWNITSGRF